ncbi:MAG: ABC transporter permease [Candidatus Binatia bacterium]|nr:MAG: ABC transporter permease [Candidatus Binatia bacterium]
MTGSKSVAARVAKSRAVSTAAALLAGLVTSALFVALTGRSPVRAFSALFSGALGSLDGLSEVAVKSCPLVLCGLAVALAFRAGLWNIGAEGQLLAGALAAAWVGPLWKGAPGLRAVAVTLCAASAAGAFWAWLAGLLRVKRGVNEVIGTIMLNFVAAALVGWVVQGPLMEPGGAYPQTEALPPAARLPRLFPGLRLHAGVFLALLGAALLGLVLRRTVFGFGVRAAGENPTAARVAGISVERLWLGTMALSGALAGLAGGIEVSAVTYRLYENFSPGYGFTGIAVALLGRLDPFGVLLAGLFFGVLEAGSNAMQRNADVSSVLVFVVQATVILFLVALERRREG